MLTDYDFRLKDHFISFSCVSVCFQYVPLEAKIVTFIHLVLSSSTGSSLNVYLSDMTAIHMNGMCTSVMSLGYTFRELPVELESTKLINAIIFASSGEYGKHTNKHYKVVKCFFK